MSIFLCNALGLLLFMFFRYSIISAAKESLDVVKPSLELSIEQRYYFVIMTKL